MTRALPDENGSFAHRGAEAVVEAAARAGALVLGPGLGRADDALAFARDVAASADVALLLDADGLNAHAGALDDLAARAAPTVLTPHAGELGRLLGRSSDEIQAHRLRSAREAARRARAVVVLKGDDTIVAAPDGTAAINGLGAPALATAGTGDVLSGVIGAFLAKGLDPFAAACAGVRRHAAAGRVAAAAHGPDGVIASDVVAALPRALEGETGGDRRAAACRNRGRSSRRLAVTRPRRGCRMTVRAVARVNVAAIERNVARLRARARARRAAVRRRQGRRLRPRRGAGGARGARRRRAWLAVVAAGEAAALRAAGIEVPILVMGALSPSELDVALAARADVVAWDERFVAAVAARGGGAVHVKLDTGHGPPRHARPGRGDARRRACRDRRPACASPAR